MSVPECMSKQATRFTSVLLLQGRLASKAHTRKAPKTSQRARVGGWCALDFPPNNNKGAKVVFVFFRSLLGGCAWVFPGIAARRDPILGIGQPIVPKSASIAHVAFDNVFRTVNHRSICVTCRLLIATESGGKGPKRTENQKRKDKKTTDSNQASQRNGNE